MLQHDLFAGTASASEPRSTPRRLLDRKALLDVLTATCARPRYNFMLLTLIAEASTVTGSAGPYVQLDGDRITIRDWLCDAMNPVGRRDPRRLTLVGRVREQLAAAGLLPSDALSAETLVEAEVRLRLRQSGRTNVSRAVSELVRAGLLRRHYKGDYVDHENRGGGRHAVYTVTEEIRRALAPAA